MTVALSPRSVASATPAVATERTKREPSVAATLLTSVLVGLVLVTAVSWIALYRAGIHGAEAFAFGAMVGFWIGTGSGLIAGGAIINHRGELELEAAEHAH